MNKITILFIAITLCFGRVCGQLKPVEIPGSHVRKITSSIVGQEYELHILLPGGYEKSTKKYPVLYLMDSQWDFPLVKSLYGQQYYDGFIPALIVVGVTWGGVNPNPDSLRARDYTPTNEKRLPQSGGAGNFLSFLKNELIPFVEQNYKADPNDRILMGCSLGGLFTLYTLFTQPEVFQKYVAASPALGWDREVIYQFEQKYFEKKPQTPVKLFMTMGGVERGVPGFEKLAGHLKNRNYTALQMGTRILENTGHSGTKAETYSRGLQYVYQRPSLQLGKTLLNAYAGNYVTESGYKISLKVEEDRLILYVSENYKYPLYAASETDFYSTEEFLNIRFKKEKEGVKGFDLETFNNAEFVAKTK